jgi:hypothetical protein
MPQKSAGPGNCWGSEKGLPFQKEKLHHRKNMGGEL